MIHAEIPDNVTHHTMIDYVCDICGGHGSIRYDHYKHGVGCSYCANRKVLPGFNDIATTSKDIIPWLKNQDDAYRYTRKSHHKIDFVCPECGYEFQRSVADSTRRGLRCPFCSGLISYPNRFMDAVLRNTGVNYKREAVFEWSCGKRYDFFIEKLSMIIEMNGEQHYTGFTGQSFDIGVEDIQQNDEIKRDLAIRNGIKAYIVVDSRESDAGYIRSSILQSNLTEYIDLSSIDWVRVEKDANRGYWDVFVDAYNKGKTVPEISSEYKRDCSFVIKILKEAAAAGECDYSRHGQVLKSQRIAASMRRRPIICITTNALFDSLKTACEYYGINPKGLSRHLTGHTLSSGVFNGQRLQWKYAT